MFIRLASEPVTERCGVPYAYVDTRAWVSMRNGRTPSSVTRRWPFPTIPLRPIAIQAVLTGWSLPADHVAPSRICRVQMSIRTGFNRPEYAVHIMPVAQTANTASTICSSTLGPAIEPSLFMWPISEHRRTCRFGKSQQLCRAFPHLAYASGRRLNGI